MRRHVCVGGFVLETLGPIRRPRGVQGAQGETRAGFRSFVFIGIFVVFVVSEYAAANAAVCTHCCNLYLLSTLALHRARKTLKPHNASRRLASTPANALQRPPTRRDSHACPPSARSRRDARRVSRRRRPKRRRFVRFERSPLPRSTVRRPTPVNPRSIATVNPEDRWRDC